MDQPARPSVREADVDAVRQIVEQLSTRKRPTEVRTGIWLRLESIEKSVRLHGLAGLAITVMLAVLALVFHSRPLVGTFIAVSTLVMLLYAASLVLLIAGNLPFLNTLRKDPFAFVFVDSPCTDP